MVRVRRKVPLIFGVGGSGTRIPARALQEVGFKFGNTNAALDFFPVSHFAQAFGVEFLFEGQDEDAVWRTDELFRTIEAHIGGAGPAALKNNHCIHYLPTLLKWFPDTFQLIHVLRDGRDMAYSSNDTLWIRYKRFYLSPSDRLRPKPVQRALLWRKLVEQTRSTALKFSVPYQEIRYEDILDAPNEELKTLLRSVGVDAEPNVEVRDPGTRGRWRGRRDSASVNQIVEGML